MVKKKCAIVISEQFSGRTILVDIVEVENSENAKRSLLYVKEDLKINPEIVTCDFSPSLISAIIEVFGIGVLQIDRFHVSQLFNNGINRDLLDYRNRLYRIEIRDSFLLASWISSIQKDISVNKTCSKDILKQKPSLKSGNTENQRYWQLTREIIKLMVVSDLDKLSNYLDKLIFKWNYENDSNLRNYATKISTMLPKRGLTEKSMLRIKIILLCILKDYYRSYRKILEEKSSNFFRNHWIILKNPEKQTNNHIKLLNEFLKQYPELKEYRDIVLQVGDIFRAKIEDIDGHRIENLVIKDYFSQKLKTAIKTLKKFKEAIIRFSKVFKKNKNLGKACSCNMEFNNRPVKAPFKIGLSLTKLKNNIGRLKLQLGCEVRYFENNIFIGW